MARPLKEINWELVEKAIEAGCTAAEIAGKFRIDINTLYDRFKKEYGFSFSDFRDKNYCSGDFDLKLTVHLKALKGIPSILLKYCEERLGWGSSKTVPTNQGEIDKDHLLMMYGAMLDAYKDKYGDISKTE